ncbi:acyl-CoA dehydrogenase family protein [Kordiimonas sp.]|uniref:acyl-CoA dehydrogenase family protein n=1 Tax=Kordiimonas sp. TaxID=1970157 RepID=UPI003A92F1C2
MDSDTYDLFLEQLKRYVREKLVPAEELLESTGKIPEDILSEMTEMGLFGITIPLAYGGSEMTITQYINTIMELSWAAPAFRSILTMNTGMVASALKNFGTPEQKSNWLPQLAAGAICSFALTEPGSGSDSANLKTQAKRIKDGYVLTGTKRYITNAPFAELVLVMARTAGENLPGNQHVSAFLVPTDLPGVTIGKPDKKMGQDGSQIADVILEGVVVPPEALLGEVEGNGFKIAMASLNTGRLSVAAAAVGYAKRILDCGIQYSLEREAFGESISNFQLIQAMLAESETEIYASQCMIEDASRRADRGEDVIVKAAAAKMFASEMCVRVANRVVQIHGGAGYLCEYKAERFFRDSLVYKIYEGTTQILQLMIAKRILKHYGS